MATLYVENVPDDLYKALRKQARAHRKSIAAEVLTLLEQHIPTEAELQKRRKLLKQLERLRAAPPLSPKPFPSAEEMIREDRER
jgi:plasmid stability protein